MLVVDSSALVTALTSAARDGDRVRRRIARDPDLAAPALIDLEVAAALRGLVLGKVVDDLVADEALEDLSATPIRRAEHAPLLPRCWELRHNLTIYDASYVALAEHLNVPLLTGDARIGRATGPRCTIELVRDLAD